MNKCIIFLWTYLNLIDNFEKLFEKKFLDWMSGTGFDEMT